METQSYKATILSADIEGKVQVIGVHTPTSTESLANSLRTDYCEKCPLMLEAVVQCSGILPPEPSDNYPRTIHATTIRNSRGFVKEICEVWKHAAKRDELNS